MESPKSKNSPGLIGLKSMLVLFLLFSPVICVGRPKPKPSFLQHFQVTKVPITRFAVIGQKHESELRLTTGPCQVPIIY